MKRVCAPQAPTGPTSTFPLRWTTSSPELIHSHSWVPNEWYTYTSAFDLVPLDSEDIWFIPSDIARATSTHYVLAVLPDSLQYKHRLSLALSPASVPSMIIQPHRISSLRALANQVPVRGIMTTGPHLGTLMQAVGPSSQPFAYVHCILSPGEMLVRYSIPDLVLVYEIQAVPGMTALYQCWPLAIERSNDFHLGHSILWEHQNEALLMTDIRPEARFSRAMLPGQYTLNKSACVCGEDIVISLV